MISTIQTSPLMTQHVTIVCSRSFEDVDAALRSTLPEMEERLPEMLRQRQTAKIAEERARGPKLYLFASRDHGSLLAAEGRTARAIQYEIGNPFTAESMTRLNLAACLYAPLRVALYEDAQSVARFIYDLPSSLFGQLADERITEVALGLDADLMDSLLAASGRD